MVSIFKKQNKWVFKNYSEDVAISFKTKNEAIKHAKKVTKGNIIIHNKNGSIKREIKP